MKSSRKPLFNEKGGPMLEYLFIAILIFVVCLAGVAFIGVETNEIFENDQLGNAF